MNHFTFSHFVDLLLKGHGHKYIKRIPYNTPKGRRYRYIYSVTHSHQGKHAMDESHLVAGTKFMVHAESGKEVHAHIKSVKGNKVTYVLDDGPNKGKEVTKTRSEIVSMLNDTHGVDDKVNAKREQLRAQIEQARKTGTEKQVKRLEERLKRLGGEPAKKDSEFMSTDEIMNLSEDEKKQEAEKKFKDAQKKVKKKRTRKKTPDTKTTDTKTTDTKEQARTEVSSANADKIATFREDAEKLTTKYRDNYYTSMLVNTIPPSAIYDLHTQLTDTELDLALTPTTKEELSLITNTGTKKMIFESFPQLDFGDFKIGYRKSVEGVFSGLAVHAVKGEHKDRGAVFHTFNNANISTQMATLRLFATLVEGRTLTTLDQIKNVMDELTELGKSKEFKSKRDAIKSAKKVMGVSDALRKLETPVTVSERAMSQNEDVTQRTHTAYDSLSQYPKVTQTALKQGVKKKDKWGVLDKINVEGGRLWSSDGVTLTYTQTTLNGKGVLVGDTVDTELRALQASSLIDNTYAKNNIRARIDLDRTEAKKLSAQLKQLKKLNKTPIIQIEVDAGSQNLRDLGSKSRMHIKDSRGNTLATIETDQVSEGGIVSLANDDAVSQFIRSLDLNEPISIGAYYGKENEMSGLQVFTPLFNRIIMGSRE